MEFKMKMPIIKLYLLALMFVSVFAISSNVISDDLTKQKVPNEVASASLEGNHPLAIVHQQLKQAHKNLTEGKTNALNKNLDEAKKWLQDPALSKDKKTQNEAKMLMDEIQQLLKESDQNKEGAIARLWHRSGALLEREVTQLSKSWDAASQANEILKFLVDARLHFNYAKHALFISHDKEEMKAEVSQALDYLEGAKKRAKPAISKKISIIQNDIQHLLSNRASSKEEQAIFNALSIASENMLKVSQNTSAKLKTESKNIAQEIIALKRNIILLEKNEQYDDIMRRLKALDKQL